IERAAMANFFNAKAAADGIHHVVRSGPGRFVDQNGSVQRREFLHADYLLELSARLMAEMTFRWTERRLPVIRAPAAAGWPPPPKRAAISFTLTASLFERILIRFRPGSHFSKIQATTPGPMA